MPCRGAQLNANGTMEFNLIQSNGFYGLHGCPVVPMPGLRVRVCHNVMYVLYLCHGILCHVCANGTALTHT